MVVDRVDLPVTSTIDLRPSALESDAASAWRGVQAALCGVYDEAGERFPEVNQPTRRPPLRMPLDRTALLEALIERDGFAWVQREDGSRFAVDSIAAAEASGLLP